MMPVQSISSLQPKNGLAQPSGVAACSVSGDTCAIAMAAMMTDETAMIVNCSTSAQTMLIIPPIMT